MNLWLRVFLHMVLGRFFRPRVNIMDEVRLRLRVLPCDIDVAIHLNNGRYLTMMDLARMELTYRSGLFDVVLKNRWLPVLAAAKIRYRRELKLWQPFDLTCKLLCWDRKWFYMEQRFITLDGTVAAIALVRGAFRDGKRVVPVSEIRASMGQDAITSPPFPPHVKAWAESEDALRKITADTPRQDAA